MEMDFKEDVESIAKIEKRTANRDYYSFVYFKSLNLGNEIYLDF